MSLNTSNFVKIRIFRFLWRDPKNFKISKFFESRRVQAYFKAFGMFISEFKKSDKKTSLLGMGAMRLPQDEEGRANRDEGIELIRYAIDQGINYIDTAFTYHGGMSERILGQALKDGYREKVIVADKMPVWLIKSDEDVSRYFEKQLKRLELECIDMYLVHNII